MTLFFFFFRRRRSHTHTQEREFFFFSTTKEGSQRVVVLVVSRLSFFDRLLNTSSCLQGRPPPPYSCYKEKTNNKRLWEIQSESRVSPKLFTKTGSSRRPASFSFSFSSRTVSSLETTKRGKETERETERTRKRESAPPLSTKARYNSGDKMPRWKKKKSSLCSY